MSSRARSSSWFVAFAAFAACAGVACDGCKEDSGNKPTAGDAGPTASGLSSEQAARVVATVGKRKITVGDLSAAMEAMDQFDRLRYQAPEKRKELLNEMVNMELLAQEAEEKGYDKDPLTQEELRIVARDAMLADVRKSGPMPADIPEADARAYYDAHKSDFQDPERRRISVLVTKDETVAKASLATAQKGLDAVAWGQLVREKSADAQVRNIPLDLAGDMGIVAPPTTTSPVVANETTSKVPEPVRAAAFRIAKVGDVHNELVTFKGLFYVVRLTQKLDPHERTYAEAERVIRVKLSEERIRAKEDALLEDLKKRYPVQINEEALAKARSTWTRGARGADGGASKSAP